MRGVRFNLPGSLLCRHVLAILSAWMAIPAAALAQETGQPFDWQLGLQGAASPIMEQMVGFHDMLLVIITLIALFVLALMVYVLVRFNAKANPVPSKTTHNTLLEVLWTVVPIAILVLIAVPSFKLLYYQGVSPPADMTVKAIGHQWYWTYEYPDEGFTFDAFMLDDDSLEPGQPRLLATDYDVVLPVGKVVRLITTADDVIHSWAIPALGIKLDSIPGRANETWLYIDQPGMYYGQCSELCGVNHAFMPIAVRALSEDDYNAWLTTAREEFARIGDGPIVAQSAASASNE